MYTGEVKVGDKIKLNNGHNIEITKVVNDLSGEYFEGHDLANGIFNSFLRASILEKIDD